MEMVLRGAVLAFFTAAGFLTEAWFFFTAVILSLSPKLFLIGGREDPRQIAPRFYRFSGYFFYLAGFILSTKKAFSHIFSVR
jgi:hypothetical protein